MPILKLALVKQSITDFFEFLTSPRDVDANDSPCTKKIATCIVLFLLKFAFSIAIAGLIGLFYEPKNITDQSLSERFAPLSYLMIAGILLPFYEECLFRLSLRYKRIYLALSATCLGYYVCTKLIYGHRLTTFDDTLYIRVATGIFIGSLCFFLLGKSNYFNYFRKVWQTRFAIIYYLSAVVFAGLHIFNFEMKLINLLLLPILTLPQLFSGLVMGYIRIRFGFLYPLLFHMITNSILVTLDILVK